MSVLPAPPSPANSSGQRERALGTLIRTPSGNGNGSSRAAASKRLGDLRDRLRLRSVERLQLRPVRIPGIQPQVRRARRIIRRVDLSNVARVASLLYGSLYVVFVFATIGLWIVATITGVRHQVEHLVASVFLFKSFSFDSFRVILGMTLLGLVGVLSATGVTVLLALLFNLISDVAGGIEVTVLEEDPSTAAS